jgi:RNA-directed DNA polymerase
VILERMSADLDLSARFLNGLARSSSYEYKMYEIKKRSGGIRTIYHPSRRLKAIQRWLLRNVIESLPVHDASTAYRKKHSILDNAKVHASSKYLLRMDFAGFFESISTADIRTYIEQRPVIFDGWTADDIVAFCKFVCRNSTLTIGAPTSPALSNALCYELDTQLSTAAVKVGIVYTRYADDLFFSSTQPNVLKTFQDQIEATVCELQVPAHLSINTAKTRHSSKRGCRRVTGIILGSDGLPYIGRSLKRKIRSLIFNRQLLDETDRMRLAGFIAFAKGLDPQFLNSLINKYGLAAVREAMRHPHVKGYHVAAKS